ncbi:hypothetical protein [Geodermatophilus sabuli]|uniref:Alpha/beta hydrolase n=1 Tax=Geodermatophilus sabuli TaxID=1564158 RepID=A0A285EI26_9ACTN|nr:hypothetical protein [Geodermatophilus sabuli]MBB3084010.1 hypothetical protein [Geodermatophilus sabuli]SNX98657.1 hypothetical protein SAMN06893097_111173 [Geodermatophilus sabuli]
MGVHPDRTEPTILLVHGVWADAAGSTGVIRALQGRGLRAIGFADPLRGTADDPRYLVPALA